MNFRLGILLLWIIVVIECCLALPPTPYLSPIDKNNLKSVLINGFNSGELSQIFYGSVSFKLLNLEIPNKKEHCSFVKNSLQATLTPELLYHASSAAKSLDCPLTPPSGVRQLMNDVVKEDSTLLEIYHAVTVLKNFGMEIEEAKVIKIVQQAIKKDDSILSLGYAFHIGAQLKSDTKSIFDRIEDVVVQADEVDGYMLQFEGGLSITAFILNGVYKLAEASKKAIPMKKEQTVKFANYLMSRKTVQSPKGAHYLLETVNTLTNNKFHIPVSITLASNIAVSPDSPKITVRVTNLLGDTLKQLKVTAVSASEEVSATASPDPAAKSILSNKPFAAVSGDPSLFEVDVMKHNPALGFYKLSINVEGTDARLVGNLGTNISFKVLSSVSIVDVEFGAVDAEGSSQLDLKKVTYPSIIPGVIDADYHQRLVLHFSVKDMHSNQAIKVHQAFVKVTHENSGREVIFIAEQNSGGVYKFELDIGSNSKELGGISGNYNFELIVGDACISNSVSWKFASVSLKFAEELEAKKSTESYYQPREEIHHLFRKPDPRPPKFVSLAFSALCVSPILILLIVWVKLGVNLSNFDFSLNVIGFHVGLGSIFGLFCYFWLQLNMFTTLRYLLALGLVTFLCGNSMLSSMAQKRKEKEGKS